MRAIVDCLVFMILLFPFICHSSLKEVDFDESVGIQNDSKYSDYFNDPVEKDNFDLLRKLYNKNKPSVVDGWSTPIIPKIIHHIWLENDRLPTIYNHYINTWKKFHIDWQFKLWLAQDIEKLDFADKELYQNARTYEEKLDIARLVILDKYGGIFVDVNIECLSRFDELVHKYELFAGLDPTIIDKTVISDTLIGSIPAHDVVRNTLKLIKETWNKEEEKFDQGQNGLFIARGKNAFSQTFFKYSNILDKTLIFPASYFCPSFPNISNNHSQSGRPKEESMANYDRSAKNKKNNFLDFDRLYGKGVDKNYNNLKADDRTEHLYNTFKYIYNINAPEKTDFVYEDKIPNILHFFWLRKGKIPNISMSNKKKWEEMHFNWDVKLWTMDDIQELPVELQDLIGSGKNVEEQEEIAKYVILNLHGGVAVSLELEPLKTLEEFVNKYDFFTGLRQPSKVCLGAWVGSEIIGTSQEHNILKQIIKDIDTDWDSSTFVKVEDLCETEALLEKEARLKSEYLLTNNLYKFGMVDGKNIALPPTYFYPITLGGGNLNNSKKILNFIGYYYEIPFSNVRNETVTTYNPLK
jgi:mannosyltransferase OCH1-like enzyme